MRRPKVPAVSIIVVNWNGKGHVLRCLNCVHTLDYPHRSIDLIVVDNGSTDGSEKTVERFLIKHRRSYLGARLLKLEENFGVPSAMNIGLAARHPSSLFVWKLDNDMTFSKDYLRILLRRNDTEGDVPLGAIGGRIRDRQGIDQSSGAVLKSFPKRWLSMLDYRTADGLRGDHVAMIVGGSCLFPARVFERHGKFDERFFLYYDETEFCLRLTKAGQKLIVDPEAVAIHEGVPSGTAQSSRSIYYMTRNHLLLGRCYFEGVERLFFYFLQTCSLPWKYFRMVVQKTDPPRAQHRRVFLRAYFDFVNGRFGLVSFPQVKQ